MKANQRFTLVAIALSCITCAGTTVALVSLDAPPVASPPELRQVGELRPSLVTNPEELSAPRPQAASRPQAAPGPQTALRPSRLDFVSPGAEALDLPEEGFEIAAADPDTWAVEVNERPVTSSQQQTANAKARSRATRTKKKKTSKKRYTLKQRLAEISPTALARVSAKFEAAKVAWPPAEVAFVSIKDEKTLELHARPKDGEWSFVHRYKVLAASGKSGPKLQRGDKQVPEGVYRISYLNPNSAYHVSLRVNYPNSFDRQMAKKDGRKDLGGDIMIHGKNVSAGCLAMGDAAAEELFVLAAEVGIRNTKVVIAPTDFRSKSAQILSKSPDWTPKLYAEIASALSGFKAPKKQSTPGLLTLLGL